MIVLVAGDVLTIETSGIALAPPLQWYVSWDIAINPRPALEFDRNFGVLPGPLTVPMTPAVPPAQIFVIQQVTVYNPNPQPVVVSISLNGPPNILFICVLSTTHTLQYNTSPNGYMGWQIFDGQGQLVSG